MSAASDSDDDDYDAYVESDNIHERRYPLHDCIEFEDIDALRNLLYITVDDSEEEDDDEEEGGPHDREHHHHHHHHRNTTGGGDHSSSSSSDENDSTAAAHAAAIGHSPHHPHRAPQQQQQQQQQGEASSSAAGTPTKATADAGGAENEKVIVETPEKKSADATAAASVGGDDDGSKKKKADEPPGDDGSGSKTPVRKFAVGESETEKGSSGEVNRKSPTGDASSSPPSSQGKGKEPSSSKAAEPTPMDVDDKSPGAAETSLKVDTAGDSNEGKNEATPTTAEQDTSNHLKDPKQPQAASSAPPTATKTILNRAVSLNERDGDENTPLHVAIHARKLEHVKMLLEAGASFRMKCDGSWPIHTAVSLGAVRANRQFAYDCVVLLREHGADIAAKDDSAHTPLFLSCVFNLPQIASYILSDSEGESTLNHRADRAGNRPLHAASKFDTLTNPSFGKAAAAIVTGQQVHHHHHHPHHHHPDGTVVNAMRPIPGFAGREIAEASSGGGKIAATARQQQQSASATASSASSPQAHPTEALLTQLLLGTNGVEVDALNVMGQTPLHVACLRGNWPVARLLIEAGSDVVIADRRGFTPGQLAYKRGLMIPNDLVELLGDPPESGVIPPPRDLIVDPEGSTLILCHELCILHRTCPPIRRDSPEPPPENVRRLHVLVDPATGILRGGEFGGVVWKDKARRAAIADILKVHDYEYVENISQMASTIPDHPSAIAHLDPDTAISHWSFEAAMRAAGSVCEAVDKVVGGEVRNSFCAVRPPGHHAGPRGIVRCPNDPEGSHGFCLLNNVAIGAAYARSMYRNEGIQKVAIIDFDVHHGNGTEEVIRQLVPSIEKAPIRTPFAHGELTTGQYRPWLDETDIQNVFFSSTHGYGHRGMEQPGWFYPASGKTHTSESITHPAMVENPGLSDFLLSQTWARMGEDSKTNCCKIINIGLELPDPEGDQTSRNMKQRLELRDSYRNKVLPHLREFDPDLIFISAGFDGHRRDTMNFGYVGMVEDDYEWITEQLIKVANTCCNGRVISVLEGGYKIHGGIVSPFARSVASHVRAMVDGGRSRELYDLQDGEWESQFEHHLFERRERKKEQEREQLRQMELANRSSVLMRLAVQGGTPEDPDAPSRKRKRNPVDYKELYKQMQEEGFAS